MTDYNSLRTDMASAGMDAPERDTYAGRAIPRSAFEPDHDAFISRMAQQRMDEKERCFVIAGEVRALGKKAEAALDALRHDHVGTAKAHLEIGKANLEEALRLIGPL